jgi:hypothetical protein
MATIPTKEKFAGDVDKVFDLPKLRNGDRNHHNHEDQRGETSELPDGQHPAEHRRLRLRPVCGNSLAQLRVRVSREVSA